MAHKFMVERGVISEVEAERCDFAWYTAWQPIEREVQTNPLLLIDAQSVDPGNITSYAFSKVDEGAYTRGYAPFFSERHQPPLLSAHADQRVDRLEAGRLAPRPRAPLSPHILRRPELAAGRPSPAQYRGPDGVPVRASGCLRTDIPSEQLEAVRCARG